MEETCAKPETDLIASDDDALLDIAPQQKGGQSSTELFSVRDQDTANWFVRRVVEKRRYKERVKEWAAQEVKRAEGEEERLLYLYGAQLRAWVTAELTRNRSRLKSLNLPAGCCGFRVEAARLVINDERLVLEWARVQCPTAVVTEERLVKIPINDHFSQTGELPPGTELQPKQEKFFIR